MKPEDLFEAISGVEDILLEENVAPPRKQPLWQLIGGLAACAAVGIFAFRILPPKQPLPSGSDATAPSAELNPGAVTASEVPEEDEPAPTLCEYEAVIAEAGIAEDEIMREAVIPPFTPGIWYSVNEPWGEEAFYCFSQDGTSGEVRYAAYNGATGFSLRQTEAEEESGVFRIACQMGVPDAETAVVIPAANGFRMIWEQRDTWEDLVYLCDGDFSIFTFFSNEDIQKMMEEYCGCVVTCHRTDDLTTVKVIPEEEDGNVYLVDRFTMQIFNLSTEEDEVPLAKAD